MSGEDSIKKAVKTYCKEIGAYYFMPVQMGYGASTLDFLICHNGRFYGVETKRPGVGKPSPRQACVMTEIAEAGGGVCLENDPELPKVKAMMR